MTGTLLALAGIFSELSLLAFGGGNSILPEMQRQVVQVHGWMRAADFSALYGLAQAAPGPNLMVVTLIGWRVAGLPGAAVTTVATFLPSSLLTAAGLTLWHRHRQAPWRRAIQAGLVPVTAGLVAASALLIARTADSSWTLLAVTAAVTLLVLRTRLHPLWLLGGGAAFGMLVLR